MIYLFIFLTITGFSFLEIVNIDTSLQKYLVRFISLLFVIVAGFRYETGVDWKVYTSMFEDTPPINEITDSVGRILIFSSFDYGYCLFISIVKFFNGSIQTVFFIISLAGSLFVYKGVKLYSDGRIVSMLIYFAVIFFILDMSGLRQGFSLSIFFYALRYLLARQFWPYLIFMLFAASFHWSAYLLIPLYFIIHKRFSSISLLIFFIFSLSIFILKIGWLEFVFVHVFSTMSNAFIAGKLFTYTSTFEAGRGFTASTIISIFFYITTFIFLIYYRLNLENRNKYFNLFFNIYILQIFAFFALYEFIEMADRLRLYFLIANIILLPGMVFIFKVKLERVLAFSYILTFAFFSCKPYILKSEMTIAYQPYQNYIIYKVFNLQSTGEERLKKHAEIHGE